MKLLLVIQLCLSLSHSQAAPSSLSSSGLEPAIVNGQDAKDNEALYQVQVHQITKTINGPWILTKEAFCGGSLLGPQTVLTAAHCLDKDTGTSVHYGSHKLKIPTSQQVNVTKITRHPSWDGMSNDIAILTLERKIQTSSKVKYVSLCTKGQAGGTNALIYGWGYTDGSEPEKSPVLQKANETILSEGECNRVLQSARIPISNTIICIKARRSTSCEGDSGGPLISPTNQLAGVSSRSVQGCPPGGWDFYTNVTSYLKWIRANSKDKI